MIVTMKRFINWRDYIFHMIIVHESLTKEAERIAHRFREVYGFDSNLVEMDLTSAFTPVTRFEGFWHFNENIEKFLVEYGGKAVQVLTPRDIYVNDASQNDDWIFGYCLGKLTVCSTARMKRGDNKPSATLEVSEELYLKRLEILAVHEIGHDVVTAPHFKMATWVNSQTGHELGLGPHCTDNTCVMYEVVDIKAPLREEGYMRLGAQKKYDAGLDDVLGRMNPKWFCDICRPSIKIGKSYR